MDLRKYWDDVHDTMKRIPDAEGDVYYLVSLDNPEKGTTAGRVVDIGNKKEAARRLVEKTHRLAQAAEVARFHQEMKRQTEELAAIEQKRKQQFAMPQELQDLVALAARGALAGQSQPPASSEEGKAKNKEK